VRILVGTALALCCAAQISDPRIGFVRDRAGDLRPVYGVAGAFVLGDSIQSGVLSAAFNGSGGLAKTADELLVFREGKLTERFAAPEGAASFGFDSQGKPDWVRFANGSCLRWKGATAESGDCPAEPEGERVRLPGGAAEQEPVGEEWLCARSASALWILRARENREPEIYRLPEAER
jgi:hypothetical protein